MATYSVVEGGKEIGALASLSGAAQKWAESRPGRAVYEISPSGPPGPDAWERGRRVTLSELVGALEVRI
jgi:hypothetical protein